MTIEKFRQILHSQAQQWACRNVNQPVTFDAQHKTATKETLTCAVRLNARKAPTLAFAFFGSLAGAATAQDALETQGPAQQPGLTFESIRPFFMPLSDFLAAIAYAIGTVWHYVMTNAPSAIILSAVLAWLVALRSIRSQREMTRIRETFNTINAGIWDKDQINAKSAFKKIRNKTEENGDSIAKFRTAKSDEDVTDLITLSTILNDYENIALGVRNNILDEVYLYRWMRSVTIKDWQTLSPLITAYRSSAANNNAYIEFEGLVTAWQHDKSYLTGRRIKKARRIIRVD